VEKIDTFNEMRTGGTWNKFMVDKEKGSNESVEERYTERAVRYRSTGGGIRIEHETTMWRETTDEFQ